MRSVDYSVSAGVARVILDAPETRNALSGALLEDLIGTLETARDDDQVRVVVIASSHPTTFCAGGDLAAFTADEPLVDKHAAVERFPRLFGLIGRLGKPVLAEVGGHCLAGGLGLALACDLVIASDSATFGTPEIQVGVFPFMIAALIFRNVPRKKATRLMLRGDRVDAAAAEDIGLVNEVVAPDRLREVTDAWAADLAAKSPLLMRLGKDALWRQGDLPLEDAWEYLRAQLAIALSTEDIREGIAAFFEKREPSWRGR